MFALIISFLKSHWQTAVIMAGIASIVATIAIQHGEIYHLRNKLAQCHAESVTLEESNKALLASIQDQNTAIAGLQALSRKKRDAATRGLAVARKRASLHELRAEKIKAQPVQEDDCESLRRLVDDFVGTR